MPVVGFGTSRTKHPGGEVEMALSAGYRHVDCAYVSLAISCQSLSHCVTPYVSLAISCQSLSHCVTLWHSLSLLCQSLLAPQKYLSHDLNSVKLPSSESFMTPLIPN